MDSTSYVLFPAVTVSGFGTLVFEAGIDEMLFRHGKLGPLQPTQTEVECQQTIRCFTLHPELAYRSEDGLQFVGRACRNVDAEDSGIVVPEQELSAAPIPH